MSDAIPSAGQAAKPATPDTQALTLPPYDPAAAAAMLDAHFAGDGRTHFERMLAGDDYVAIGEEFAEPMKRTTELQERFNSQFATDPEQAQKTLAELLGDLGPDAFVRAPLYVDWGFNISLGARTFVNMGLVALDVGKITIGEDCLIGPNVQLLTPTHPLDPALRRTKVEGSEPITLGNNVWLGGGVVVCPGVTIGDNSVIGAGSVVTKDIPANVVAVGNPARVIRQL